MSEKENVECPIEALEQINQDHNTQYMDYIEYFAITRFSIKQFVWAKEANGIYCEVYLKD